jgi:uncharacterized protein (TIGR03437 family)
VKSLSRVFLGIALAACAYAQPTIRVGEVYNAASQIKPDLPNGAVARGAFFTIKGTNLGPVGAQIAQPFPFPTQLGGSQVKVTVSGTTVDAFMYYAHADQINAILPSSTPSGTGTVVVIYNGQTSATAPIRVVDAAFGMFTFNQGGSGPARIFNVNSATDQPDNMLTSSARPGQVIVLWGTGLGPVTTPNEGGQAPAPGDLPTPVEVYIGGQRANVLYKGRSGFVGVDQINVTVPQNVEGCYVPVVVKTGDIVSNFASVSVARNGGGCTDTTGLTGAQLESAQRNNGFKTGNIVLARSVTKFNLAGISGEIKADTGAGSFFGYTFNQVVSSSGLGAGSGGVASLGACTVYSYTGTAPIPVDIVQPTALDAGPVINVNGPKGAKQLTKTAGAQGIYSAQLSSGGPSIPGLPGGAATEYLDAGAYTVDNGSGGSGAQAVGAFRVNLTLPAALNWTNMDAITTVPRTSDLLITWTGGDQNGYVLIVGGSAGTRSSAGFSCLERANAGRFSVPSYVLSTLPATSGENFGLLSVNNTTQPVTFTATGLDLGTVTGSTGFNKTVTYR